MKRLTTIIILTLIGALVFASNIVSFSGKYALVGSDGRTIRKTSVDISGTGVVLATGDEMAKAECASYTFVLGENSLAALKGEEESVLYLVYGSATVVSNGIEKISVYTPTTLVDLGDKGEYHFISTDKEEKVYNFSSPTVSAYDSIRGRYTSLSYNEGYDYLKGSKIEIDEEKRYLSVPIYILTPQFREGVYSYLSGQPDTPVLEVKEQKMNGKPDVPLYLKTESEIVNDPDVPVILDSVIRTIVEEEKKN